jgi:integrase
MTVNVREVIDRQGNKQLQVNLYFEVHGEMVRRRLYSKLTGKKAAKAWGENKERELYKEMTDAPVVTVKLGPKLGEIWPDYLKYCEGQKQKDATRENKLYYGQKWLLPLFADLELGKIVNGKIFELRSAMTECASSTINNVTYALRGCMKYAIALGVLDSVPFNVPRLKRVKSQKGFYYPEQLDAMYAAADPHEQIFLLLGSHGGLRAGEIAGLEKRDIDFAAGVFTVTRAVRRNKVGTPKSNKAREVAMSATLAGALKRHFEAFPDRGPRVLYREDGRPVNWQVLANWMKRCCARVGLPPLTWTHLLRHSFITNLGASEAVAPRVIMDLAGHHDLSVTLDYMHLHRGAAKRAVSVLDKLGNGSANNPPPLLN